MNQPKYFMLNDSIYHQDEIVHLRLDGGASGHGCWGDIRLRGWDHDKIFGDGSYYNDGKHVNHLCAHDHDFSNLRKIMKCLSGIE